MAQPARRKGGRSGAALAERSGSQPRPLPTAPRARARRSGRLIWVMTGIAVVLLLLSLMFVTHATTGSNAVEGTAIGNRAPDFTLQTLNGKSISLSSLRGRPLMVHFWGVPCTTCAKERPTFVRALKSFGAKPPLVLAVESWNTPPDQVAQFQRQNQLPVRVLLDPGTTISRGLYQVQGTPTAFYIDKDGIIRKTSIGAESYDDFIANFKAIGV